MSSNSSSIYEPLPTKTSIRVLLLAPGPPEDEVFCWLMPIDLESDHELSPTSVPRPIQGISVVHGKTPDSSARKFIIPFDIYIDDNKDFPQTHQFQRYTALSYVWGSTENPEFIILNGESRFPVTRNLYAALKAMRSEREGRTLWVDALCINQTDFDEKKGQIGLMRRVYRQAEKVVAFVPLSEEDQGNIPVLVERIWAAKREHDEKNAGQESIAKVEEKDSQNELIPIPELEPKMIDIGREQDNIHSLKQEAQVQEMNRPPPENAQFLEDFGLPPVDSPLWASWRRFFASPYFRRIWILQEFALAKSLGFCFGTKTVHMEPIIAGYMIVKEYSGAINAHYLGHSHEGDPEELSQLAMAGGRGAELMFMERVLVGKEGLAQTLLEKLRRLRSFDATDPRDKIYALLGVANDGAFFADHVSYSHDQTPTKLFPKFAGLFVQNGNVFEVLSQAGLESSDAGLPSWVPNWASSQVLTGSLSSPNNHPPERITSVKILPSNTLLIHGTLSDEVHNVSNPFNQVATVGSERSSGGRMIDTIRGLVNGILLVLNTLAQTVSIDEVFDLVFQVLVQKKTDSTQTTVYVEEIKSLRIGFGAFLGVMKAWGPKLASLEDGKMLLVECNSPEESRMFNQFLQRVFQTTAYKRLCVTKLGYLGLVPYRTEVGDIVAVFDGSTHQFILRTASQEENDENPRYKLVGSGYLQHPKEGEGSHSKLVNQEDIRLI